MKKRLISELKKCLLVGAIGLTYYLWVRMTNLYIPCIFKRLTGFRCPGCGITHMIMAVCRLDFLTAWNENPFLFVALPVMGIVYAVNAVFYIQKGVKKQYGKGMRVLEYTMLLLTVIFWVVRNIPGWG